MEASFAPKTTKQPKFTGKSRSILVFNSCLMKLTQPLEIVRKNRKSLKVRKDGLIPMGLKFCSTLQEKLTSVSTSHEESMMG